MDFGFVQSKFDYSLFTLKTNNGDFVALMVYVDDIVIGSSSQQAADKVKSFLKSRFKLKDLGALKYFLGLEVAQSHKGIYLCQWKYALDLIDEYGYLGAKPLTTPIDYNAKLTKASANSEFVDPTVYR